MNEKQEKLLPYRLKFHQLKVTKYFKNFVTFNRQNFLTDEIDN